MKTKKILLVEDNPNDVILTERALKKNKLSDEVIVARDGVDALDYLFGRGAYSGRDLSDQPVVILLDLNLPKINGLEVLRALRQDERTRLLPVVILISSREEKALIDGYRLGVNGFVNKPVDFNKFCDAVRDLGCFGFSGTSLRP